MRAHSVRLICFGALIVLLAGIAAAQAPPPGSQGAVAPEKFGSPVGRIFTHSVLSELGSPTW